MYAMIYQVTALFSEPIDGLVSRCSTDTGEETLAAETVESAARAWLWRLTTAQREALARIVVSAMPGPEYRPYAVYKGDAVEFVRSGGKLERCA